MKDMIFGNRLNEVMEIKQITNRELAEKLSVAETTISGYRNGRRFPDLDRFCRLCQEISTSADYLLGLIDKTE